MPLDHPSPPAREPSLTRYLSPMCSKCSAETPCLMVTGGTDRSRDVFATGPGEWYRADEVEAALRRERDSSHRARLILAPHPGATPADDTGCGCAVSSLEELAVAVVERLRREREESERFGSFLAHAAERGEQLDVALRSAVADRDRYKASLAQFLRDTSEAMSCLPGCDSQAHEELCPVVNPAAAWRMLNADRDRYRAALEFYGAKATYQPREHPACGSIPPEIEDDMGERARLVLLAPPTPAAQAKGE